MTDTGPSKEVMAKLAQGSYQMGDKDLGRKKRLENTQNLVSDTDWLVEPNHTNSEITTYRHKDDASNIVIAHRGTKLGGKRGKTDLEADIMFAMGLGGHVPNVGKAQKKKLENKVVHHRIKHDPVSLGFKKNLPFGKLETDSIKHDKEKGKTSLDYLISLNPELKKLKSVTERGLHAHAISNFHDGSIKNKN